MNFRTLRFALCLFTATELLAQYAPHSSSGHDAFAQQWLFTLSQEFNRPRVDTTTSALNGGVVTSLHSLSHKPNRQASKLADKGSNAYVRGRFVEALACFQKAANFDPQSTVLQNNLGIVYGVLGQDEAAFQAFQKAVQLDVSNATSSINLAAIAFNHSQYQTAETSARRVLRVQPRSPQASLILGLAEVAQDHWTSEARQLLTAYGAHNSQVARVLQLWPSAEELRSGTRRIVVHGIASGLPLPVPDEQAKPRHFSPVSARPSR